jgi:hypothetical protein
LRPRGSSSAVATIPAVARVRAGARDNGKSAQSVPISVADGKKPHGEQSQIRVQLGN